MTTIITLATVAVLFALATFHVYSKGKEPTMRVMGYSAVFIALISIWQFEIWPAQPFLAELVVLIGAVAALLGLWCLWKIFRPGWNRT